VALENSPSLEKNFEPARLPGPHSHAIDNKGDQSIWKASTIVAKSSGRQTLKNLGLEDFSVHDKSLQADILSIPSTDLAARKRTASPDALTAAEADSDARPITKGVPGKPEKPKASGDVAGAGDANRHGEVGRPGEVFGPVPGDAKPLTVDAARESLQKEARLSLSKDDLANFKTDMADFETRAKSSKLPDSEVAKTYHSVESLLNTLGGNVSTADLHQLAQQVMHQAAHPNSVQQGPFDTCAPATLETLIYTSTPSAAADLVAQSALYGEYRKDNDKVAADAKPSYTTSDKNGGIGRSYASQIFQTVALNVAFSSLGENKTYEISHDKPPADEQQKGPGINGRSDLPQENLMLDWVKDAKGRKSPFAGTSPAEMGAAYQAITEKDDLVVIAGGSGKDTSNVKFVNTPEKMKTVLQDLQTKGNVPVMVFVDSRTQPFWSEANGGAAMLPLEPGATYGHVAAVTGYDSANSTVSIHTNWRDTDSKVSVADLARATQPAEKQLPGMGRDFVQSLAKGTGDYAEAIDALRIRSETGRISTNDLNRLLKRDLDGLAEEKGNKFLADRTVQYNVAEIMEYLNQHNQPLKPTQQVKDYFKDYIATVKQSDQSK
jgi:hypothetical protein